MNGGGTASGMTSGNSRGTSAGTGTGTGAAAAAAAAAAAPPAAAVAQPRNCLSPPGSVERCCPRQDPCPNTIAETMRADRTSEPPTQQPVYICVSIPLTLSQSISPGPGLSPVRSIPHIMSACSASCFLDPQKAKPQGWIAIECGSVSSRLACCSTGRGGGASSCRAGGSRGRGLLQLTGKHRTCASALMSASSFTCTLDRQPSTQPVPASWSVHVSHTREARGN